MLFDRFQAYIVEAKKMRRYRVECNFGSRYFADVKKAVAYYYKCVDKNLDVEIWLVIYIHRPNVAKVEGLQMLLAYSGSFLPKF